MTIVDLNHPSLNGANRLVGQFGRKDRDSEGFAPPPRPTPQPCGGEETNFPSYRDDNWGKNGQRSPRRRVEFFSDFYNAEWASYKIANYNLHSGTIYYHFNTFGELGPGPRPNPRAALK
ncbi:Hypothetical protein NTJ_07663 [Nesidiocoris tenuis]|uniref:Uncharacterized protein n=1 Tax=Nesidiocoris tenuis TaxID=355587 RepID=A0ABN7ARL4_9HEMI|nr:Hypothetical protein NTJ_07663 [Nesidiocoris tenuis]